MSLTFTELEAITDDYFLMKESEDIYSKTSWTLEHFLMQRKGLWDRPSGGRRIRVPIRYDRQTGGFFTRGDTLSSDDRKSTNAAYFDWKHSYGNATVYHLDELENAGPEAQISLITERLAGAQETMVHTLASSIFDAPTGDSKRLTGLLHCCNATTSLAYGGLAEDDIVMTDGTKPWKGRIITTVEGVSLPVMRTLATTAHLRDGAGGDLTQLVTTKTLYDIIQDRLQKQQRFTQSEDMVKAGFKNGCIFEGMTIYSDDYCPSGYMFGLNDNHLGFAVHTLGFFVRELWSKIESSPGDRTMKIYFHGNLICKNRSTQIAHSNLS